MFNQQVLSATGPSVHTLDAGAGLTIRQLSMKLVGSRAGTVVNLETSPDGTTWTVADVITGISRWGYAGSHVASRFARANVVAMGTSPYPRVDAAGSTTSGSTIVGDAAAVSADAGMPVTGAGIPAGAFIVRVTGTGYVLSVPATATASGVSLTVGKAPAVSVSIGYYGKATQT